MTKNEKEKKLEKILISQINTFYDELMNIKKHFKVS